MSNDDIVPRLRGSPLIPSIETDLQVVHGLAAELRDIQHDHAGDDGFVKFSGMRWLSYYHSLNRILIEHDRRQAEMYKAADEIERFRAERDEARREILESLHPNRRQAYADARGWDCFKEVKP
jgi:hypothetical protein